METNIPIHLIVLFPLLGAIINGTIGGLLRRKMSESAIAGIASAATFLPFMIAVEVFFTLKGMPENAVLQPAPMFDWIISGNFHVPMGFYVDHMTSVFLLFVTGIGFLIHIYSASYMHDDPGYYKFFTYLNLFMFSMLMLVTGENLLLMFVGWEGVGVCSYLLIGYWYEDHKNADAGKKAFITNRVGDFGFLLGMFFILYALGTHDMPLTLSFDKLMDPAVLAQANLGGYATIICLLMFVGAMGKSAQIPLFVWLPDAMAGPTSVSALIHAATMVTAGVFMVSRMNFLFSLSPEAMTVVTGIGAATALFAATIGIVQNDIKKVLAYSTVSQLGYMFMGVGCGAYAAGLFHVLTHAFFKACLFLGSGSVIHAVHSQDVREMGGLRKFMPITGWTFLLSTLAIIGTPLFSGFFSKDEILWKVFSQNNTLIPGPVFWVVGVLGAMCTAFYMVRVYCLTFEGEFRGSEKTKHHLHESPKLMTIPLIVLAGLAVVGGFLGMPHWLPGHPHNFFHDWLHPVFAASDANLSFGNGEDQTALELALMAISVGLAALMALLAYMMYAGKKKELPGKIRQSVGGLYTVLLNKYYVDELYVAVIVNPIKRFSSVCWRIIDDGIIDGVLVNRVAGLSVKLGGVTKLLTSGDVQRYAAFVFIGFWALMVAWIAG